MFVNFPVNLKESAEVNSYQVIVPSSIGNSGGTSVYYPAVESALISSMLKADTATRRFKFCFIFLYIYKKLQYLKYFNIS